MSPTGEVTTMARGSSSVETLVAASARYAASRAEPGRAIAARVDGEEAGIVDSTRAERALPAVRASRIEWSRKSMRTGTPIARRIPSIAATATGRRGEGSAGMICWGRVRSTMAAKFAGTIDACCCRRRTDGFGRCGRSACAARTRATRCRAGCWRAARAEARYRRKRSWSWSRWH